MRTVDELRAITPDQFRSMPPEEREQVLADCRREVNNIIQAEVRGQLLEQTLVPRIPIRKAVAEPQPDPEAGARQFFRQFPGTTEIKIGGVTYTRSGNDK